MTIQVRPSLTNPAQPDADVDSLEPLTVLFRDLRCSPGGPPAVKPPGA